MIERMQENVYVRSAALVASKFMLDPVMVLKSSYFDWALRIAAANYVAEMEAAAHEKSKKSTSNVASTATPSWIG